MEATAVAPKHPILVVDDETEILHSLDRLLRREFEVVTAASAGEALQILGKREIHVILTDQRMPEMTGVELLAKVQGECPDAIRIIFTGYADLKAVIAAINEGRVFRYVTKPWDPDELKTVLRQACAEYDEILERKRLLADVRDYQAGWLRLVAGLGSQKLGTLTPQGEDQARAAAEAGQALLKRLDCAVAPRRSRLLP
jgi:DNA-binding NtrC family response regulator